MILDLETRMYSPLRDTDMLSWLHAQVRILEAWREDITRRPELDFQLINGLERHYQWLTSEVARLEANQAA